MIPTCRSWKIPPVSTSLAGTTSTGTKSPFSLISRICIHSSKRRITSLHLQKRNKKIKRLSMSRQQVCFEPLECRSQQNACFYRSRRVRVLAWMIPRSHRVGFLPDSACLWPNTSMATAPSVRYSMKSSLTDTASSCRTTDQSEPTVGVRIMLAKLNKVTMIANPASTRHHIVLNWVLHLTLQLSNTTMQCGSLVLADEDGMSTSGATMMGSGWSQNRY